MSDKTQDSEAIILWLNKETRESIMARTKASEDAKRAADNAEPVTQVDMITRWAEDQGIWNKFQKLPQPDFYTFRPVGKIQLKQGKNFHKTKLYLGQNKHHATWALIRIFKSNKKAVEVVFQNESDHGDYEEVSNFENLALMYPFRVFKDRGKQESMRHLKVMVQYAFLDSGEIDRVFSDSMKTAFTLLSAAMSVVNNSYEAKGGVESIPDIHAPEPITETAIDDDAEEDNPDSQKRRPQRRIVKTLKVREILPAKGASNKSTTKKGVAVPVPKKATMPRSLFKIPSLPVPTYVDRFEEDISDVMSRASLEPAHGGRDIATPVSEVARNAKRKAETSGDGFEAYKLLKSKADIDAAKEARLEQKLEMLRARKTCFRRELQTLMKDVPKETIIDWAVQYTGAGIDFGLTKAEHVSDEDEEEDWEDMH